MNEQADKLCEGLRGGGGGGEQGHTVVFGTLNTQSADRQLTERTLIQRGCFDWTWTHCGLLEGCVPEWSEGGLGKSLPT